jgi:Tfp pilus assembly protein PilF
MIDLSVDCGLLYRFSSWGFVYSQALHAHSCGIKPMHSYAILKWVESCTSGISESTSLCPVASDHDAALKPARDLYEAGDFVAAEAAFRKAASALPTSAKAHNYLGAILKARGLLGEAEKEFCCAISLDPRDAKAHNNLGNLLQVL